MAFAAEHRKGEEEEQLIQPSRADGSHAFQIHLNGTNKTMEDVEDGR